jgi:plastocyanin
MLKRLAALSLFLVGAILAACAGRDGGTTAATGNTYLLPSFDSHVAIVATLPSDTIGEELPSEGIGTEDSAFWQATVGGFTQTQYAQALGFPPKTKITVENLSKNISHTFNEVEKIKKPPADFPTDPVLSTSAHGNGIFGKNYASGSISPGKSVTVMLKKAGIYLIGCAFHYGEGMHDVLVIKPNATPGPEGTPPAR